MEEPMVKIEYTGEVKKLTLKRGDVLVVRIQQQVDPSVLAAIRNQMAETFEHHRVVVYDERVDFSVVAAGGM